jgi:hypothetical protein
VTRGQLDAMPLGQLRAHTFDRLVDVLAKLPALHLVAVAHRDYSTAREAAEICSALWDDVEYIHNVRD